MGEKIKMLKGLGSYENYSYLCIVKTYVLAIRAESRGCRTLKRHRFRSKTSQGSLLFPKWVGFAIKNLRDASFIITVNKIKGVAHG